VKKEERGRDELGGDHDSAFTVDGSIPQTLSRESGENDRVDGSDPSASEEGSSGLPGHGKVARKTSETSEKVKEGQLEEGSSPSGESRLQTYIET